MFGIFRGRCFNAILKRFRKESEESLPREELVARFEIREQFLSNIELRCHRLLSETLGDRAILCPKPRVLESLRLLNAHEHLNDVLRIDRKHVDFLVCDPDSGHPLCAVQIDWWIEDQERYRPREHLLEQAFSRAGLPVIYLQSNRIPSVTQMRQKIEDRFVGDVGKRLVRADRAHQSVLRSEPSDESLLKPR